MNNLEIPVVFIRFFQVRKSIFLAMPQFKGLECDPPGKDGNVRFTLVPLEPFSDQV